MGLGLGAFYGKMLTGEKIIREFLTVGANDGLREKVYLAADGQVWDVTGNQWLLGLDPRMIGIWVGADAEDLGGRSAYRLYFHDAERKGGEDPARGALAALQLEYINQVVEDDGTLFLFRVLSSTVHHIDPIRARLLYQKFYKKPGVDY